MDPTLEIMTLLRNYWSLTGDLALANIVFSTRFYDTAIMLPQIVILPVGGSASPPLSVGSSEAIYQDFPIIGFHIYVRPKTDSNSSIGWAKNAMYRIRRETERILRSGSVTQSLNDDDGLQKHIELIGWDRRDDLSVRPVPLFQMFGTAQIIKYKKGVGT